MQRMFVEDTPWRVSWMERILPCVLLIAERDPKRTIFTRFVPPKTAEDVAGTWRDYYLKWPMMTGDSLAPELIDLLPELAMLVPPAAIFNKRVYSPWFDGTLQRALVSSGVETLVISGGETDVCVLATVLGAIDLGHRVILVRDAVCSGADETHDASLDLLSSRFSVQLTVATAQEFLDAIH
ncbi:cysteine hydrolase family protein [Pseudaminobacter sp. NGMCC 1.201702]|uniref:cysteine hydrolase n=1 Tax=Pseudaminobacter sp. NGMCC 1.201702 TaxID=3391825 RepID=UPI0039F000FB